MNNTELTKNARVEVTQGLWKGFKGIIEDIHEEASVVRLKDDQGEVAYARKEDVKLL